MFNFKLINFSLYLFIIYVKFELRSKVESHIYKPSIFSIIFLTLNKNVRRKVGKGRR